MPKAYKATEGVTNVQLEDFMTIVGKLKGVRKTPTKESTDSEEAQVNYSISKLSHDQLTNNIAKHGKL